MPLITDFQLQTHKQNYSYGISQ